MKSFALATLAAMAAAQTRVWVEGTGQNGTSGQWVRLSAESTANMLPNSSNDATNPNTGTTIASGVTWNVITQGVYYEDSGEHKIRITHKLVADIFATDSILFELAYRPKSQPNPTDTATIGEDYVQCEMTRSSTDGAFWSASVAEGYYICKATAIDSTDVCKYRSSDTTNYTQTTESTSDWVTPYSDDDADDFWCTKTNTVAGATLSPFECSALKCVMERAMDTANTSEDYAFTYDTTSNEDYMVIQPGRARLYVNKGSTQFSTYAVSNDWMENEVELKISMGAAQLAVSAIASLALVMAF